MARWCFIYTRELETQSLKYPSSYPPVSFSLPEKLILRTGILSLITEMEASEATADHCLVKLHNYISCRLLLSRRLDAWHISRFLLVSECPLTAGYVTAIHHFQQAPFKCSRYTVLSLPKLALILVLPQTAIVPQLLSLHLIVTPVICTTENSESRSTDTAHISSRIAYSVSSLIISLIMKCTFWTAKEMKNRICLQSRHFKKSKPNTTK